MSLVQVQGNASGTGTLTIAAPNTNNNYTLTLPLQTGTLGIAGPAFSAYQSTAQSITLNTWTKLLFQTEEFDTNSCFASSTFTPTVAGYYLITGRVQVATTNSTTQCAVYKNGTIYKKSTTVNGASGEGSSASAFVYLNGTTDYVDLYGWFGSTQNSFADASSTYFQASLVRSA